jgi:fructose-1-phosphate kinase PfkB-like protein
MRQGALIEASADVVDLQWMIKMMKEILAVSGSLPGNFGRQEQSRWVESVQTSSISVDNDVKMEMI